MTLLLLLAAAWLVLSLPLGVLIGRGIRLADAPLTGDTPRRCEEPVDAGR